MNEAPGGAVWASSLGRGEPLWIGDKTVVRVLQGEKQQGNHATAKRAGDIKIRRTWPGYVQFDHSSGFSSRSAGSLTTKLTVYAIPKLLLPSATPLQLGEMVHEQLDPLLADVHSMLRLPIEDEHGLEAGCNLSATLVLLEEVGGISVELYDNPSLSNRDKREQRGKRFKQTVQKHFPWDDERHLPGAITHHHAAKLLYDAFRNPLAHRLGTYDGPYLVPKGSLSDQQIEAIEKSETRPIEWTSPTLATDAKTKEGRTKTVLTVKCLYWGIRRMIWSLLEERVKNVAQGATNTGRAHLETTATAGPVTSGGAIPYVSGSDGPRKKD